MKGPGPGALSTRFSAPAAPFPMPDTSDAPAASAPDHETAAAEPARRRPKPGERRLQILRTLAQMLERPGAERITTSALAAQLELSEAALYRHFRSKAQMFEGLIEFIETSLFGVINQISAEEGQGLQQVEHILALLLNFAQRNRGMTRVLTGDALVLEDPRLAQRMNQFFDRIESQLRQLMRRAADARGSAEPTVEAAAQASALTSFCIGRLQRFARTDFRRSPVEQIDLALQMMIH